jgi:hypothetical protein
MLNQMQYLVNRLAVENISPGGIIDLLFKLYLLV